MKKLLTLQLLFALLFLASCTPQSFTVDGKIEGLTGKAYLAILDGKQPRIIDSAEVAENGAFVFKGKMDRASMAVLQNEDHQTISMFMIENSPMTINGTVAVIDSIKVSGSTENDLYRSLLTSLATVQSPEQYKSTLSEFINANPRSQAAGYALFRQLSPYLDFAQMREIAATLDTTVQNSTYIKQLLQRASTLESTSVGQQFVDFTAPNLDGQPIALSSVAGKGKWVLLDFWASWCAPCRAENPHVVSAYNTFKDKGFTVFGYSLDRDAAKWAEGVAADSLSDWTNVSDVAFWESEPAKTYGVGSIPSNVLINPEGKIVARNLRGEDLIEYLNSNINQ